jgi:8-oxo-dGTP pyrophosphatase MutT (NUDIX family)
MMAQDESVVGLAVVLFVLPDGRLVLQRRSQDTPIAPGKLGFFGGHIEDGESAHEAVVREIGEETSLDVAQLRLEPLAEFALPPTKNYARNRHFYVHRASIQNSDFEVYEGDRAEAYTAADLRRRDDLSESIAYTLENIIKE